MTPLGEKACDSSLNGITRTCVRSRTGCAILGIELVNDSFFNEFTVKLSVEARRRCGRWPTAGSWAECPREQFYPGADALQNGLCWW